MPRRLFLLFSTGLALFATDIPYALAADTAKPSEATFLIEIVLLVVIGRALGEGMQRIGQPAVMGQLLAGILLGPSVFGFLWPQGQAAIFPAEAGQRSMIEAVASLGVLMLLLLTGMETDLRLVKRIGRPAITVSVAGIVVPFLCGLGLGEALPDSMLPSPSQRLITALFLGTALSISSVKIVAMVVRDLGFQRRNIGQIIVASSILDDTIAWILIAIISSLPARGTVDVHGVLRSVLGTAIFLAVSFTIGRQIVFRLIRWTNDTFISEMPVITVILAIMGTMALATDAVGVHTVLGAFVAGMLVGNSPILTREIDEQLRGLITALFMPVFFGLSGLSADVTVLLKPRLLLLTLGLVLIASAGKFGGAFLGGRLAGLTTSECLTLGCGMNARGSTEIIIATIGLSVGALDQKLYTMIVAMALLTTLAMPPMLRWASARVPATEEESERLKREAFAEKSFVAGLERLLVGVDESKNGQFASRLAGLIAGARGVPTTILHLHGETEKTALQLEQSDAKSAGLAAAQTVKAAADTSQAVETGSADNEPAPAPVDVTMRVHQTSAEEAVAGEARKGYDMLVVGLEKVVAADGRFDPGIARIVEAFDGPVAIADARGPHLVNPLERRLNILTPVTGTEVSRRAVEIALSLARSTNGRVTALYVSNKPPAGRGLHLGRTFRAIRNEEAILREAAILADRYRTPIRTAVSSHIAPEEAILRRAERASYDLIVMGVTKRSGEELFFGNVASAILGKSKSSILLVAS